jgi:8-oxo-dGTP pyrophosphatase MutT (NUDIX family)
MSAWPVSIKGVLIHGGRVLLLLNERGEWDLPGGRPDPGEDHRAALKREVREETGLEVEVGRALDEHLFEVLPQKLPGHFVRIEPFACAIVGTGSVTLSHEHLQMRWLPLAELGEIIAGHPLPRGYLGAIRQAIDQSAPERRSS